jgi:hypothetical protein
MIKSNSPIFDGPVPNMGALSVTNVNDASDIVIRDALTIGTTPFPWHSMMQHPDRSIDTTSVPVSPDPMTGKFNTQLPTTEELQMVRVSILEVPPSSTHPVPIPEPKCEAPTSTCDLEMITVLIDELEARPSADPVPIPQPYDVLLAVTVEFTIIRISIFDVPPPHPPPHPQSTASPR